MATVDGVTVLVPPPPGYVVDFDNPQRQAVISTYTVSAVGMVLAALMMGQRLYVKAFLRRNLGIDDLLLVIAWFTSIAFQVMVLYGFAGGFVGVHIWEISIEKAQMFFKYSIWICSILYSIPNTFAKLSILWFYREINNHQAWYCWSIYLSMFVVAASGISMFFTALFTCYPFEKNYDLTLINVGSCINRIAAPEANVSLSVATDILILCIPIPMIMGLKMSRRKKLGLLAMFAVGSATLITSTVRLIMFMLALNDVDLTWAAGPIGIWTCLEANLFIICAAFSTLNYFIKAIAPRVLSSDERSSNARTSKKKSSTHNLQTIGSMNLKRLYHHRLDTTETVMGTTSHVQGQPPKSISRGSRGSGEDSRSDKGIVQTKETFIYYEAA